MRAISGQRVQAGNSLGKFFVILLLLFLVPALIVAGQSPMNVVAGTIPAITNISPGSGNIGAAITVSGSGFGATQETSYVSFGSIQVTQYTAWSDTSIQCRVPGGAYGRTNVTVTTSGGTSNPYVFGVLPRIDKIQPNAASIDEVVEIVGSGYGPARGGYYVSFGSTRAVEYASWSDTSIHVKVPRGVQEKVNVTVVTDWGASSNAVAFTVLQYAVCFAEGYTGSGFQEYLCLGNMQTVSVAATIGFLFSDGSIEGTEISVPANSRVTVDVNEAVGGGMEVSALVFSDLQLVVERPMYFKYGGHWTGGHDVIGTPYLSKMWCFAEGYTGAGFEEWICVLNPDEKATANLTFHFQTKGSGEIDKTASVPPGSRKSVKVNELLGNNYECSLLLESDQFVVAERSMYFDYGGKGAHHWEGGHCVMGLPYLSTEYFFAEGCTRNGFEEWLTIQNPFMDPITVNATYQLGVGQGNPIQKSYAIAPESRNTVYMADEVGAEKDVSVKLSSNDYFLAERPMYFRYTGYGAAWEGGHCVIGAIDMSSEWFFAEGYTGQGFQEWLCLQNPGDQDSVMDIYYLGKAGVAAVKQITVPARSRRTLRVNDEAGANLELSCHIKVVAGPPVVAERPMYFTFRGWDGGHDVLGYYPESYILSASYGTAEAREAVALKEQLWELLH